MPFLITEFYYFMNFFIKPGIIPINHPYFLNKENKEIENNIKSNNDTNSNNNKDEIQINILNINNNKNLINTNNLNNNKENKYNIFTEREFSNCNIIRLPRASHCNTYDKYVLDFLHYCFFAGICEGKRNPKYFYLFIFFGTLTGLYLLVTQMITIIKIYIASQRII